MVVVVVVVVVPARKAVACTGTDGFFSTTPKSSLSTLTKSRASASAANSPPRLTINSPTSSWISPSKRRTALTCFSTKDAPLSRPMRRRLEAGKRVGDEGGGAPALWSKIEKKKHRQNSHPIIHCPTSERLSEVSERMSEHSGGRKRSEQPGASE